MRLTRLTGITTITLGLLGCANRNAEAPMAPAASESRIMEIRQEYQRKDANTQVGVVVAVEKSESLAAVSDVMLDKFRENDVVTFIDSSEKPIANGVIIRKTANNLHVKYEEIKPDGRDPVVGDLAVKF